MIMINRCVICRRYRGNETCTVYKDRIPNQIFTAQHDHREPFKGDNGIRFKPIKE